MSIFLCPLLLSSRLPHFSLSLSLSLFFVIRRRPIRPVSQIIPLFLRWCYGRQNRQFRSSFGSLSRGSIPSKISLASPPPHPLISVAFGLYMLFYMLIFSRGCSLLPSHSSQTRGCRARYTMSALHIICTHTHICARETHAERLTRPAK